MAALDHCSLSSIDGSLSIDRLTLLFYCPKLSLWNNGCDNTFYVRKMSSLVKKLLGSDLDPDFPQGSQTELFSEHFRTISGFDIQFGTKMPKRKKITDEHYLLAFGSAKDKENGFAWQIMANEYALRIEFNPNKSEHFTVLSPIFASFSDKVPASTVRVGRIDIAIDYPADVNPSMVLCDGVRKSFTATGCTGLESVYFGTRSSKSYYRLYNKRQEILDNEGIDIGHPLWRLELESKESFFLTDNPNHLKQFQRFKFFEPSVKSGDWLIDLIQQQAAINGLQNVLRSMPSSTQKRYRKIFNELHLQNVESPSFIYARDFLAAWQKLRADILFAFGYDLVDATLYKDSAYGREY